MNKKALNKRREKLLNQMKDNEIIILYANSQPTYPRYFLQENNFLYFTGLNVPDAIFVMKRIKGKAQSVVFIERGIPEMEVWEGKKMTSEEASNISDIKAVSFLDEFARKMQFYLTGAEKCYVNSLGGNLAHPLNKQKLFIQKAKEHFPQIEADNAMKLITPLRAVKDKDEIKQLQKAIDITALGIESIRAQAEAGMMEYELEAILKYEANRNNSKHMSFHPIIASGVNAATLHYHQNHSKIGANDLVLLDVGAAYNSYCADISRTFPVSGKFTNRQEAVYSEVLNVNKTIIEMVKPGITMVELNKKTVELISDALIRLKLIKDKKDYFKYYMHSVGHHLGMDAHDFGPRDKPLEPGHVITVEPGIYIAKEKIGVRIEDDILVTKTGYKNLSNNIPKEINDLEK